MTLHLSGKGAGALLFKGGKKAATAYFRQRVGNKDQLLKIGKVGRVDSKNKNEEIATLREVMREAERLYALAATVSDVKAHLENEGVNKALEAERRKAELAEINRQKAINDAHGTLSDLIQNYIDRGGKQRSMSDEIQRVLEKDIKKDNPEIAVQKARDVTPEHIVTILRKIYDRGSKGMAGKVRGYLHTAYNLGLKHRYTYTNSGGDNGKSFELTSNPVSLIPKNYHETPGTRSLNEAELRHFYKTVDRTKGVSERMGLLFKLNIQLGGQRILQLAREPWASYDLTRGVVTVVDLKGRPSGDAEIRRHKKHILPLTRSSLAIVERLRVVSDGFDYPFSEDGRTPYLVTSFSHATKAWLESSNGKLDGEQIPHFTPKDLRRTCAQLMKNMNIPMEESNILQSHGLTGMVMRHYLNDPELFVADKAKALAVFEKKLGKILNVKSRNEHQANKHEGV
ncbi:integrase [Pseudomonas sp. RTC3]|uniref:tyrosine-type recombinase/integrase n=1 Tax=Pseudomonas sp. 5C2 TaxID=3048588 RepID=UPI002AB4D09E|nr:tyrosine-type recombinase/integrase [Pseudomonas sp. 5C2]MDY7567482.1 integrase [Pseudomonas sp. 5C2]MEB0064544.1 integrase [Pseudomonas sp. RTC3]MEB0243048.1 integrase [Pseudomonas sp. 5C2]